ncbi:hypothetical protein Gohar_005651 [Gossypium harknessii]|uniref:Uncharacterized protein n=1 Tax=Gossypium harknessii TaxID=34285 RepID=A0A7J9H8Q9_9ROSI|nr:hypothetical protein [Gossypium harknessii]
MFLYLLAMLPPLPSPLGCWLTQILRYQFLMLIDLLLLQFHLMQL